MSSSCTSGIDAAWTRRIDAIRSATWAWTSAVCETTSEQDASSNATLPAPPIPAQEYGFTMLTISRASDSALVRTSGGRCRTGSGGGVGVANWAAWTGAAASGGGTN